MRKSTKLHNELNDWYSLFIWNRFGNTNFVVISDKNARVQKSSGRISFFVFHFLCCFVRSCTFITCDFWFFWIDTSDFLFLARFRVTSSWCLLCFGPLATASQRIISLCNIIAVDESKKEGGFFVRLCNLCALCAAVVQKMHLMLKANRFTFTSAPKTITTLVEDYRCAALFVQHFHMVFVSFFASQFIGGLLQWYSGRKAVNLFTFIITFIRS